jgi:hypothetical protein
MKISSHSVKVTATGFEDYSKAVDPSCGNNILLNLASEMSRAKPPEIRPAARARVGFSVEPANATVSLLRFDGTPVFGQPVVSPLDVEPGAYKLHASLSGYADGDFQFIVHAGQDIPGIAVRLVASAKLTPRPWSPPLAPSKQGWEKVAKLSLYGTENASGTYEFRLQRRGSIVHKSFSSWIVGYRAGDNYAEFRVDAQDLQWRKSGGAWNKLGSVEIPNKAAEIYVSVTVQKGAVTTAVGDTPESAVQVGEAVSLPEGLFGLAMDTAIRGFHHSP